MRTPLSVEFEEWPSFALFFNVCFMIVDIFCLFFCLLLSLVTRIIRPTSQCFFLRLLNCSTSYWFCWKITLMFVCADRSNPRVATFNLIWKLARMFHLVSPFPRHSRIHFSTRVVWPPLCFSRLIICFNQRGVEESQILLCNCYIMGNFAARFVRDQHWETGPHFTWCVWARERFWHPLISVFFFLFLWLRNPYQTAMLEKFF